MMIAKANEPTIDEETSAVKLHYVIKEKTRKITELESKLAIAIEALEKFHINGDYETGWRALEALNKIKGE